MAARRCGVSEREGVELSELTTLAREHSTVDAISRELADRGRAHLNAPRKELVGLAGHPEADALLNDLDGHPHAYVLACLGHRQAPAQKAWMLPHYIKQRAGTFAIAELGALDEEDWLQILTKPTPAHRRPVEMSRAMRRAVARIIDYYDADASLIWTGTPTSEELVKRFRDFYGAGPKIATMAANILVRDFKVQTADYRHIDLSVDVHVLRVMKRLGVVEQGASRADVIKVARELNPDFPGIIDLPIWSLGHNICGPKPRCGACYMNDLCTYSA